MPPELYSTGWFIAAFADCFPVETRLRVWDVFLLEGVATVHNVGMAFLRLASPKLAHCADAHGQLVRRLTS